MRTPDRSYTTATRLEGLAHIMALTTLTCETPGCDARAMFSLVMTLGATSKVRRYCYTCLPMKADLDSLAANIERYRPGAPFEVAIQPVAA